MKPFAPHPGVGVLDPMQLEPRATLPLVDQEGLRIVCLEGQLWITQHHDQRDIVLQAGESFVLDKPGLAIVFALKRALLTLSPVVTDLAA
jgi:hypothetical protein